MVSLNEVALLALGVVISAGLAFLCWTLYRLAMEAQSTITSRRDR